MNQFKRVKVIMLPTKYSNLGNIVMRIPYYDGENFKPKLEINKSPTNTFSGLKIYQPQHLYIVSDDEIKEGDYVYDSYKNSVYQATKVVIHNMKSLDYEQYLKKIIATTDSSLEVLNYHPEITLDTYKRTLLPQPSQQFIEKYIESYNKGEVITDVLVEYEADLSTITKVDYGLQHWDYKLKVNPKDNTITIKKLKESWNRKEVTDLIKSFANNYQYASNNIGYNKWIEENL